MNKLQTRKVTKNKSKKTSKIATQEQQFQREWERIQNLKNKNAQLRGEIESFYLQFNKLVEPTETIRFDLIYSITQKLIGFLDKKSLTDTLTEMLMDTIHENLSELQLSPFADAEQTAKLEEYLEQQIRAFEQNRKEKFIKKLQKQGVPEDEIKEAEEVIDSLQKSYSDIDFDSEPDDIIDDLFAELDEETGFNYQQDNIEEETFWERADQDSTKNDKKDAELKSLLKATPVNALFRKVARALHPDLEQNPLKKQEKHKLMSQLIEARDKNDIPTILNFYQKYVGALPEGLFKGNFEKLTALLKHQTQNLKEERQQIIFEDPTKGGVYKSFKGATSKKTEKNIQEYIQYLNLEIRELQQTKDQITSIPKLKKYLDDQYDARAYYEEDYPF